MNQPFQAIYEGGVLRPLERIDLKEHEVVSLSVVKPAEPPSSTEQAARQKRVLLDFLTKMESLPDESPRDGLSNRDHDRLIYGQ